MVICLHRGVIETFSRDFGKITKYKSTFRLNFLDNLRPVLARHKPNEVRRVSGQYWSKIV